MKKLSEQSCSACQPNSTLLAQDEIKELLLHLEGWQVVTENNTQKLTRIFNTKKYANSMSFTNRIAELAETINHHPLLIVEYASVTVVWWSHEIKGLHKTDFIMAAKTDTLFTL